MISLGVKHVLKLYCRTNHAFQSFHSWSGWASFTCHHRVSDTVILTLCQKEGKRKKKKLTSNRLKKLGTIL